MGTRKFCYSKHNQLTTYNRKFGLANWRCGSTAACRHAGSGVMIRSWINWGLGPAGRVRTDPISFIKIKGQGGLQIELRGSDPRYFPPWRCSLRLNSWAVRQQALKWLVTTAKNYTPIHSRTTSFTCDNAHWFLNNVNTYRPMCDTVKVADALQWSLFGRFPINELSYLSVKKFVAFTFASVR